MWDVTHILIEWRYSEQGKNTSIINTHFWNISLSHDIFYFLPQRHHYPNHQHSEANSPPPLGPWASLMVLRRMILGKKSYTKKGKENNAVGTNDTILEVMVILNFSFSPCNICI